MPLTGKGNKILEAMRKEYGSKSEAEHVLYASKNKGTITGIDSAKLDAMLAKADAFERK